VPPRALTAIPFPRHRHTPIQPDSGRTENAQIANDYDSRRLPTFYYSGRSLQHYLRADSSGIAHANGDERRRAR